jgi:hypothetical protein
MTSVFDRVEVDPGPLGCWFYTGPHRTGGYGVHAGQQAHRVAYAAVWGPIPPGHDVAHECADLRALLGMDATVSRRCVNPVHLAAMPRRQNLLQSPLTQASVNKAKTHCPRGHALTPENNTNAKAAIGQRECAICKLQRDRERRS